MNMMNSDMINASQQKWRLYPNIKNQIEQHIERESVDKLSSAEQNCYAGL
jgi:hypothetical protein